MKINQVNSLLAAIFIAGSAVSAQAATFIEISGADVDFFYDADFWRGSTVTVSGNAIGFALASGDYAVSVTTGRNGDSHSTVDGTASSAVVAIAHKNFALTGEVFQSGTATYLTSKQGGSSFIASSTTNYSGAYFGGAFSKNIYTGSTVATTGGSSDSIEQRSGNSSFYSFGDFWEPGQYSTLGLDIDFFAVTLQTGPGTSAIELTSLGYRFDVAPTAVPEPETDALLLAGFGVIGLILCRRRTI